METILLSSEGCCNSTANYLIMLYHPSFILAIYMYIISGAYEPPKERVTPVPSEYKIVTYIILCTFSLPP